MTGASKAFSFGLGPAHVILGAVIAVGGGTFRDVMIGPIPAILRTELHAIPALVAATIAVVAFEVGRYGILVAVVAALICFAIRMAGVHFRPTAPGPRGHWGQQGRAAGT